MVVVVVVVAVKAPPFSGECLQFPPPHVRGAAAHADVAVVLYKELTICKSIKTASGCKLVRKQLSLREEKSQGGLVASVQAGKWQARGKGRYPQGGAF